ncbi:hypothetical protein [Bordetella sp. N]|uniref:hypothetical protein n=1 Tax=Bordetella sp. N TaxID=1746199 RepID=UPI00070FAA53|nr:hypothetical protein [Bordetella sp. N]ALM83110.1 hypothetical protein ASB57_09225 [Bordetella sp. N]
MFINLYIHPRSVESQKTLNALTRHLIPFVTHWSDDPEPVVDVSTPDDTIVWRGHRPDLIELLADLDDVVPARAVARAAMRGAADVLTRAQAHARITGAAMSLQAFFDECGDQPLYRGATLFWWLRH